MMPQVFHSRALELGGIPIRRAFPQIGLKQLGPWVFFDHMGPASLTPKQNFDVPPHPHIGLATFTYLFAGSMMHRDSLGSALAIEPGAINLMISGQGITHSEREPEAIKNQHRPLHGLQLWLALPEENEQQAPEFHHYEAQEIPEIKTAEHQIRLLMGKGFGEQSPVKTLSPTFCAEVFLEAGCTFSLPEHISELGLYLVEGELSCQEGSAQEHNTQIHSHSFYKLGTQRTLTAQQASHFICLGGEPIGKRYIDWNFVASNKELIEQAKTRWRNQTFPKIPGDDQEYIPLPER